MFRIVIFSLILSLFVLQTAFAVDPPRKVPKGIWDTTVENIEGFFDPSTPQKYLQGALYYGGERQSLAADKVLQFASNWKLKIHNYQIVKRNESYMDEQNLTPGKPDHPWDDWKVDAFQIERNCRRSSQSFVDGLNKQCGEKCTKNYSIVGVWGTLQGMDWKKDGILFFSCGAVSIDNSDQCFNNFPDSCTIQANGNDVQLFTQNEFQSGTVKEFGIPGPKTRAQLIQELHQYAQTTHQSITIPSN